MHTILLILYLKNKVWEDRKNTESARKPQPIGQGEKMTALTQNEHSCQHRSGLFQYEGPLIEAFFFFERNPKSIFKDISRLQALKTSVAIPSPQATI